LTARRVPASRLALKRPDQTGRVFQRGPLGERELHVVLVGLNCAHQASAREGQDAGQGWTARATGPPRRCRARPSRSGTTASPARLFASHRSRASPSSAFPVLAPWPTAGAALTRLELLLSAADTAFASLRLLGVIDPADELVACERGDVPPGSQDDGVGEQRRPQVCGQLVHDPAGNSLTTHAATIATTVDPGPWPRSTMNTPH